MLRYKRASALLMAFGFFAISQVEAQARPFAACYAVQKDAIGCWLSEQLGGDYIMPPDISEPTGEDAMRLERAIERFQAAPAVRRDAVTAAPAEKTMRLNAAPAQSLSARQPAQLQMKEGGAQMAAPMAVKPASRAYTQICATGAILDMIEKSASPQEIAAQCYK